MSGTLIRWDLITPPGANLGFTSESLSLSTMNPSRQTINSPMFVFQGEITDLSGGIVTATLITVTEVSLLEGSMVECVGVDSREGPLTINLAGKSYSFQDLVRSNCSAY